MIENTQGHAEGIAQLERHLSALHRVPNVLVVDDDGFALELARFELEKFECTVELCNTGSLARERINSGEFDLAFVDLVMPGNGAEQILRDAASPRTKVVVLTNYPEGSQKAEAAGAMLTFPKPLTGAILEQFLRRKQHAR